MESRTANEQPTTTNEQPRRPEKANTPAGESHANPDEQATLVAGDGARANTPESEETRGRTRPAPDKDAGDAQDQSSGPIAGDEARRAAR